MFFSLVKRSSQRSRKENGLFFVSLVIAIVAFYIILSLENQDVMIFLKEMESDAVNKLFQLIPGLYGLTLFILFFLVYFSGKYQMERRSHEFGMYLMMGMRRSKLFFMLLAEEAWTSLWSLLIGIPAAVFISEIISLATAKIVGLGIIGHQFSFSLEAVLWTIAGYCLIRCVALLILSGHTVSKKIVDLLAESQEKKHRFPNRWLAAVQLLDGILMLGLAYGLAIVGFSWSGLQGMGITLILGLAGTFMLFHGLAVLFEMLLKGAKYRNGLAVFNFRQIQETVFYKQNTLAVSSLLILMALCCFGYGISVSAVSSVNSQHLIDYTFENVDEQQIKAVIDTEPYNQYFGELFEVRTGLLRTVDIGEKHSFSVEALKQLVEDQENYEDKEYLLNRLDGLDAPYLISLSGYNQLREQAGKAPIQLTDHQIAIYYNQEFSFGNIEKLLQETDNAYMEIDQEHYEIIPEICYEDIVTDRAITIAFGLVVSDHVFERLIGEDYSSWWNGVLKEEVVEEYGLMQAIRMVNGLLDETSLEYESFLKNIGRQLFYTVAASYTTIYLAVIFFIIANTVIGVQFLMQQQKMGKRYRILRNMGCSYKQLCQSARKQIRWYFSLPIAVAALSSIFGIRSLLTGIVTSAMGSRIHMIMMIAIPVIILLVVVELVYMGAVMRMSDRRIGAMMDMKRED